MNRTDFVKKLGEDIVSRFRVFNHNAFDNCVYVGTTRTFKTKVYINEEYMHCDLKIVIGSCVPHGVAGFGGGAKLIMPGIAAFETVNAHHSAGGAVMKATDTEHKPTQGMGIIEDNMFRHDLEEAADLAGIDFLINTTLNLWGESVAIYAGENSLAFEEAVKDAKKNYRTAVTTNKDIVIANAYGKVSESMISLPLSLPLVNKTSGDIVIVAHAPDGQVLHYLVGVFGKCAFACQYSQCPVPPNVKNVIVFNRYPHRGSSWFAEDERTLYRNKWEDVLKILQDKHGAGARVAVIPDATHQYFGWYE
jgi:nickel-dependent lactate racemase